jgi:ABC-type branched-subunit amino acid transport system substrate-binding protein
MRQIKFRRGLLPAAAGTALMIGLAACGSSGSSSSASSTSTGGAAAGACSNIPAGPINIAEIQPLSGANSTSGGLAQIEAQIDVNYFNAHDSVCGHKFALTFYNDKSDPATGLSLAREIVTQGDTIMLGDSVSTVQNAIQPYLMEHHVLVVVNNGAAALSNPQTNPTFFNYGPSNEEYAQTMVNWAKSHNDNDVGILSDGTSFSVELAADTEADAKAAGLTFIKTITYSPTAIDLTTQLTEAKEAGIKTLFPTGFTGVPAMVSGLKQIGWSPTIVGWGGLNDFEVTAAEVPPGTVDACTIYYQPGQSESTLLTPANTALLKTFKAAIGVNPALSLALLSYPALLIIKHAVMTANSLDGQKLAAALEATTDLPTNLPDVTETFSPTNHDGLPSSGITECTLKQGPYDILYAAS